ncbi:MAG TPA: hypothetical protein VEJ84_15640 [Acidimicrobiales bacterium]|nr:hypothetical protein [Acidimicrobiales bacterium]
MLGRRRSLVAVATSVVVAGMLAVPAGSASSLPVPAGGPGRSIPPAGGCTDPGAPAFALHGLSPRQLAAAYDVAPLWAAGDEGADQSVALLLVGDGFSASRFQEFEACFGPYPPPPSPLATATTVLGSTPPAQKEGILDPQAVAAIAPEAHIYMFVSGPGYSLFQALPKLMAAALDPANTGNRLVDSISMSFDACEARWLASYMPDMQAMQDELNLADSLGVAVFVPIGDGGSVNSYTTSTGQTACIEGDDIISKVKHYKDLSLGINYPASSPEVTAVGGTELAINGTIPLSGSPQGGTITNERVWNEPKSGRVLAHGPTFWYAGAGGQSRIFTVADAPWEADIGVSGPEEKPDIAALAGSPKYLYGGIGTSGSSPFMAGAIADLDEFLEQHGAPPIGPLDPTLYNIAAKPPLYDRVFNDITTGTSNMLHINSGPLDCCKATTGYDMASGLGSLNVAELGDVLLAQPQLRVPWTTLGLSVRSGAPLTAIAVTNNVLKGTPYAINMFINGKLATECTASPCTASATGPAQVTADVGPPGTAPFTAEAIVSAKETLIVPPTKTHCRGSSCT